MASRRTERRTPPPFFFELHWGGVHLVVEQVPYRLLAIISGTIGTLGGTIWFGGR